MSHDARRRAVKDLAGRLKTVHQTTCPDVGELHAMPQLLDPSPFGEAATRRLMVALHEAARLPHVDPGLLHEAIVMVSERVPYLEPFDSPKLIHGDLTFENILWDGDEITALLDFEWARPGPPDLDLDVLLRFISYPKLHVAADYEHLTKAEDYLNVAWWLAEDYPELFNGQHTLERLRIYSIAWDVQELLTFPPRARREDLHDHHPLNRLHRTVRGEGHLDELNASNPEAIASA
jgi:aminoglycoside phosphotransferase (APT) family kinase protein